MAQYLHQTQRKSRSWMLLVFGGLIMLMVGFVVGNTDAGPLCGSPFSPDDDSTWMLGGIPGLASSTAAVCEAKVEQQTVAAWGLILVGITITLVGIIVRAITRSRPSAIVLTQASQPDQQGAAPDVMQTFDDPYLESQQHSHPPQVKTQVGTLQPRMVKARKTTSRLWSVAGIAAIVAGSLGLLFSAVGFLPDLINGYGSAFLGIGAVITSAGSLIAGIMVRVQRDRRRRAAPIALMSAAGLALLICLPAMNFGLGLILFGAAITTAVVSMAFGLVRDEREVLEQATRGT